MKRNLALLGVTLALLLLFWDYHLAAAIESWPLRLVQVNLATCAATARAEGLALVTRDENIRKSPMLKTIW
jgi:predicted nucleic acid-binding protein